MPELPEVEFCRRALVRWTAGRRVVGVDLLDGRSVRAHRRDRPSAGRADGRRAVETVVLGAPPGTLLRHGKRLLWEFGERALLLHLGMTGKWTRRETPHAKLCLRLAPVPPDEPDRITFSDPRLLGGVVPCSLAEGRAMLVEGLGPDALREPLPPLRGRRAVKLALMDQSVVAGLGNLHAAEALWRAGLDPRTPAEAVRGSLHTRLAEAVRTQLEAEIAAFDHADEIVYVEDAGADNPFPVYGQGGRPCPRCATPIESFVQGGRTTWWCPGCQRNAPSARATSTRTTATLAR